MTFRQSLNNLIDSSRPESPTDAIFIFGSVVVFLLVAYATTAKLTVPHIEAMVAFLVACKGVKVWNNKVTERKSTDTPEVQQ